MTRALSEDRSGSSPAFLGSGRVTAANASGNDEGRRTNSGESSAMLGPRASHAGADLLGEQLAHPRHSGAPRLPSDRNGRHTAHQHALGTQGDRGEDVGVALPLSMRSSARSLRSATTCGR